MRSTAPKLFSEIMIRRIAGTVLLLIGATCIFGAVIFLFWAASNLSGPTAKIYALVLAAAGPIWLAVGTAVLYWRLRGLSTFFCLVVSILSGTALVAFFLAPTRSSSPVLGYGLLLFFLAHLYALIFLLWPKGREPTVSEQISRPDDPGSPNWRKWLLNSLADASAESAPDRFVETALAFLAVVGICVAAFVAIRLGPPSNPTAWWIVNFVWSAFWLLVLWPFFVRLKRLFQQAQARSAEGELLKPGSRRPILYLRSFQLDQHRTGDRLALLRSLFWQVTRPEQILARELRRCGPVIAIGRPDERLPELGAARFYASNDRWRDKIADVAHVSQLVVCATGTSEGLAWELSHMIATEPPEKLVLWAHPRLMGLDEAGREAEWTRFLASLGHLFPKPLPERLGETCFIHFGSTFAPIPVAPQVRWWRQRRTIRAVLTAKGLPKPDLVLRAYRHRLLATAGASAAAVLLAGSGILRLADRLEDRERNRFELRLRDSARERDGLDSLTEILVSNESAETPFRILEQHQSLLLWSDAEWQQHFAVSAQQADMLRKLTSSYVQIFWLARQESIVEEILYARGSALFANMTDVADAAARLKFLTEVSAMFATLWQEYGRIHQAMKHRPLDDLYTQFEFRTNRRQRLLEAEAAILRLLADNSGAWHIVTAKDSDARVPQFSDVGLQYKVVELANTRHDAFEQLRIDLTPESPPNDPLRAPDPSDSRDGSGVQLR